MMEERNLTGCYNNDSGVGVIYVIWQDVGGQ